MILCVIYFAFFFSCAKKSRFELKIDHSKWYFEFEKELVVGYEDFKIVLKTNWPGEISAVVAKGILGKQTIKPMRCKFIAENERICIADFTQKDLNPKGDSFFWFIVKVGESWIHVPNPKIANLPPAKWHVFLGVIKRQ